MIFEKQPKPVRKEPKEKGSREWINWAVSKYWNLAIKIAWHYTKKYMNSNTHEFQDLFQSIMLRWLETMPKFQGREKLKAWFAVIAANVAKEYTRKYNRRLAKRRTYEPLLLNHALTDYSFEQRLLNLEFLQQIINNLTLEQRQIALLHFLYGYTNQEVADSLEKAKPTIEGKVTEIKKMVQIIYPDVELEFSYQRKAFFEFIFEKPPWLNKSK